MVVAHRARDPRTVPVMAPVSQNGYPANNRELVSSRLIPGTSRKVTVRNGPAGDLLLWVAGEFDRQVEDIDAGQLDDWGYAERQIIGGAELSNHASGTAIDLNAPKHPLGVANTFSVKQRAAIHAILARAQGCVRWGGDYSGRVDEMHFEIVKNEAACRTALAAVREADGLGAQEMAVLKRVLAIVTESQRRFTIGMAAVQAQVNSLVAGEAKDLTAAQVGAIVTKATTDAATKANAEFKAAMAEVDKDLEQIKEGQKT